MADDNVQLSSSLSLSPPISTTRGESRLIVDSVNSDESGSSPKHARLDSSAPSTPCSTPNQSKKSIRRRLRVAWDNGEQLVYSPSANRHNSMKMIKDSPMRRSIQRHVTVFKMAKACKEQKPSQPSLHAFHGVPLTATTSEQMFSSGLLFCNLNP